MKTQHRQYFKVEVGGKFRWSDNRPARRTISFARIDGAYIRDAIAVAEAAGRSIPVSEQLWSEAGRIDFLPCSPTTDADKALPA